ncbi:MAG: hypothetical protein COT43_06435 [Candidatus Marinimicrobia bacterium CG08_land_8_20_14_0_20_45_22]|nr:MAG: hypothetical protein COT43_06435 [Candidatus Marinimicrobia bacterium CG08_land_8_20_14_0_20_45_22]
MICYLHGFASSGNAVKAQLLKKHLPEIEILSPDLPIEPLKVIALIDSIIQNHKGKKVLLVGSSLGGFYAYHFYSRRNIPAVLLNPTIDPVSDMKNAVGMHRYFNNDESFEWKAEYLRQLGRISSESLVQTHGALSVYLAEDDQVLDYRKAERFFQSSGCMMKILKFGGHTLTNFTEIIPEIHEFYEQI